MTKKQSWTKLLTGTCFLSALTFGASSASAELLAYEGFNYERHQWTEGSNDAEGLTGLDGGFGWGGTWEETETKMNGIATDSADFADSPTWTAGARTQALSFTDSEGRRLITSPGQVRTSTQRASWTVRPLARPLGEPGETIWISFLAQAGIDGDNYSFLSFDFHPTDNGHQVARLGRINSDPTPTHWGWQTTYGKDKWGAPGPLTTESVMYLAKFVYPEDVTQNVDISIWFNPELGSETELGAPDEVTFAHNPADIRVLNSVALYGRNSIDFDELRIGTTFDSVTPYGPFAENLRIESVHGVSSIEFDTELGNEYHVLQAIGENWERFTSEPVVGDGEPQKVGILGETSIDSLRVVELFSEDHTPNPSGDPVFPVIEGLALHLDASATDSLTLDGYKVDEWRDAHGKNITFTPSEFADSPSEDRRPSSAASFGPNNRDILLFDGTRSLNTSSPEGLALANDIEGITFFSVIQSNYESSQNIFRMSLTGPTTKTGVRFVQFRTSSQPGINVRRTDSGALHSLYGGEQQVNEWGIDSSMIDFNTAEAFLFQNGKETGFDGAMQTPGRSDSTDSTYVRIGSSTNPDTIANAFMGDIAEILFFNRALTQEERNQVGVYLSDKYDLPYLVSGETDIPFNLSDAVTLSFRADAGVEYTIEATNDLTGTWTDTGISIIGVGANERTFVTITDGADKQFFRGRKSLD